MIAFGCLAATVRRNRSVSARSLDVRIWFLRMLCIRSAHHSKLPRQDLALDAMRVRAQDLATGVRDQGIRRRDHDAFASDHRDAGLVHVCTLYKVREHPQDLQTGQVVCQTHVQQAVVVLCLEAD